MTGIEEGGGRRVRGRWLQPVAGQPARRIGLLSHEALGKTAPAEARLPDWAWAMAFFGVIRQLMRRGGLGGDSVHCDFLESEEMRKRLRGSIKSNVNVKGT